MSGLQFSKNQLDAEKYVKAHKLESLLDDVLNKVCTAKPQQPLKEMVTLIYDKMSSEEKKEVKVLWATQYAADLRAKEDKAARAASAFFANA